MKILVTGGAGFIGSNFVRFLRLHHPEDSVVVLDALTYAGNLYNLAGLTDVEFVRGDISEREHVDEVFRRSLPDAVVHFAAESHVDRSIHSAEAFARTNVVGTLALLDVSRAVGVKRFLQVSTDEVYGSLEPNERPFTEDSPLRPSSPYSASKAAADHFVLSYHRTHGLDAVVTRSSNNYGPFQFPEKFVPHAILRAFEGGAIPIYGDGMQRRDWIHVEDHCEALDLVLRSGRAGEIYNIGGGADLPNLSVARRVIDFVGSGRVQHVGDRPGHDRRYAVDASKIHRELGWAPRHGAFVDGLHETIRWYRENEAWWRPVLSGEYRSWVEANYTNRGAR